MIELMALFAGLVFLDYCEKNHPETHTLIRASMARAFKDTLWWGIWGFGLIVTAVLGWAVLTSLF